MCPRTRTALTGTSWNNPPPMKTCFGHVVSDGDSVDGDGGGVDGEDILDAFVLLSTIGLIVESLCMAVSLAP